MRLFLTACCFTRPLVRRYGMPHGTLVQQTLILWLSHLGDVPSIIVLAGGATHLLLIIKIAKIMLILLSLFWICLHLANILLWTYRLGAQMIYLRSRSIHKACYFGNLENLRGMLDTISNKISGCSMFSAHSLGPNTIACFVNHP